jgi:protoporphyrinogen oxidase
MQPVSIAIIGGGPGGLMTAHLLGKRAPFPMEITLFEASGRLGGKVRTKEFSAAPIRYEAGAAELYDYSQLGPDPLRELVHELGLSTRDMDGDAVIMNGRILKTLDDIRAAFGDETWRALRSFELRARSSISPAAYYETDWNAENQDRLSKMSFSVLLDELRDENARRYIQVALHSDLATEPEKTSGMYGLQNYLMNLPQYMKLYSIDGGIERLTQALADRLADRLDTSVKLDQPVVSVERTESGSYLVMSRRDGALESHEFDFVVAALPNNWLPLVDWRGPTLAKAMREHSNHYAYPAHYLRVSVLFKNAFWRDQISDSYFMSDAFGGCCIYDESSRNGSDTHGVLGWLLGGDAALTMSNFDDETLIAKVLESLPPSLQHGKEAFVEARVHRWVGAVNGLPGGRTLRDPDLRPVPDPEGHPEVFVVGDYLFDSTINGVLDSADIVTEWIIEEMMEGEETDAETIAARADRSGVHTIPVEPAADGTGSLRSDAPPASATRRTTADADSAALRGAEPARRTG